MQNIQDLKEKIFFESKNIIDILEKINNVDELLSKQDLVDELANRISFLRLLEKNIEYFITDNSSQKFDNQFDNDINIELQEPGNEVTEEEAIFNNELNEIVENEFHESFVDEERVLANAEPENDEDIDEEMFTNEMTEEEVIFNNQLNEIDEFENEISDYQGNTEESFDEEEQIQYHFESEIKPEEEKITEEAPEVVETIPSIFDTETLDEEILIEENEEQFVTSNVSLEQGEMVTETSNLEGIVSEIKSEAQIEEKQEEVAIAEDVDRRKIVEIDRPISQTEKEIPASDESFENLEAYQQEKKIRLANIKGLKAVQTLFDDDPLEREILQEKPEKVVEIPVVKEDLGSIVKTNIPTDYMEAEKQKPEFRLDLNDRIAFSKTLFGGSQSELNEVVAELNRFKTLEEAKEYLSDLYYEKNWSKVDEYAQRLWMLVENKFL